MNNDLICIENTRFIFKTNFSGDPERDNYGNDTRCANIIIPDEEQARELAERGFNVRQTKPKPGQEEDFEPTYFVKIIVNFDSKWPPKIVLVSGDSEPQKLDEESIDTLDKVYVLNVNALLNPYINKKKKDAKPSLYVKTLYVEQDVEDDPFAARYARKRPVNNDEEGLPFN